MPQDLPSIEDLLKQQSSNQGEKPAQSAPPTSSTTTTQPNTQDTLQKKVVELEKKGKEAEAERTASLLGVGYINLKGFPISPNALTLIPEERATSLNAVVFLHTGPELRIGAVNPDDQAVKDVLHELSERYKSSGKIYKISEESLAEAIKLYRTLPKIVKSVKGIQIKEEELVKYQEQMDDLEKIGTMLSRATVTDILVIVMAAALKLGSSDIHIEAEEKGIVVRLRIDGILQEITELDKENWKKIINRIKLVAGLKLNINNRPQDGRFTIYQQQKKIDVRTSTMPTSWGESVVMRILNPDSIELDFSKLGFRKPALERLMNEVRKPHGMIVTTGPTGSGKTTTLYSILRDLNEPGVKIITLEDPVEYKLEGINQSQIDHSKDYTFAKGLRSILRQDPDIVMVGEIRDLETAETAIQAALTGHLLISTIHTNDAAGAIPRFISMGVKPFLLAPAINAIMGQRLARRLCSECKVPVELDEKTKVKVKEHFDQIPEKSGETAPDLGSVTFMGPKGCPACNGTGYKGRVGLYEILVKDAEIEKFILSGEVSEYAMREVAQKQGMVTMTQDGLLKASEGDTSVEEIQRTTGL